MTPTYLQLRTLREERDLTQVELAKKAGLSQSAISRLESGETRLVDLDLIDRLVRILNRVGKQKGIPNLEPGDLLGRSPGGRRVGS